MERTLPKYAPSILPLLIIPCIGRSKSHVLNGKKCRLYQWDFFHQRVWGLASHQCKFHFVSMYSGLGTPYGSNNMKIGKEGSLDVWIYSLENDRWSSGSVAYTFSINWGFSKWKTIVHFTLWHDLRLKHCHPSFLRIVFRHMFDSCESIYCHFNEKTLLFKFPWLEFRFKSFLELLVHFKGFMCIRMRKLHQNARFQLMHTIDAKLCSYLMFQNSFRNVERQNNYHYFLDDRLELWPSTIIK